MIKIAHARISETGRINGKPGDQTGNEVSVTDIYDRGWLYVFRFKYKYYANEAVTRILECCENPCVGYSQDTRDTLLEQYKQAGAFSLIRTNCNCDCSSLIAAVLRSVKIYVPADMYTAIEKDCLEKTGYFETLVYSENLDLMPGDILLADGHTAMVVQVDKLPGEDSTGKKYAAVTDVFLRAYPEKTDESIRGVIKVDQRVTVSDVTINGFSLIYCEEKHVSGFVSFKHLRAV